MNQTGVLGRPAKAYVPLRGWGSIPPPSVEIYDMSPFGIRYIDITATLIHALEHDSDLDSKIEMIKDCWDCTDIDIADTVLSDDWCFSRFKKSWLDPNRKLTKIDRILLESQLEMESKLRRS